MKPSVASYSEHQSDIRAAMALRKTIFGEFWMVMIARALGDLRHQVEAEDIATARNFLLNPDSGLPEACELLAVDYERVRRKAFNRSARLEATFATMAAHNRRRAREKKREAAAA